MIDVTKQSDSSTAIPPILVALAIFAMAAVFAVLIFVPAGRLDWTVGWIYLGVVIVYAIINWACLARWNPELIARR
ncbi:MAG: isoprenylcysteine carboxylmethyltransferase family protein, partial [Alphaproteobacteria bacterium]|nr:isoprenylcysteine carboxylmethyltransferase family protein [Alphaproteobacteria bacterium]